MLLALAIDRCWGEPAARWHPVVWMGRYLEALGWRIAPLVGSPAPHKAWLFSAGALAWWGGALGAVGLAWAGYGLLQGLSWWQQGLLVALLLKPLLAWRMLRDEVLAVESALGQSLEAGRSRLAWLVSRDVQQLTAVQVRESAIESLAENLNDSVVAPLFWFAVAGLPGAALYRFANTADAMWGYLGPHRGRDWRYAGKWAARADDLLSWLPARITGVMLVLLAAPRLLTALPAQARCTPSPNSGWPMAAMALVLNIQLGKPGVYRLHPQGREPGAADTLQALAQAQRLIYALVVAVAGVVLLLSTRGALWQMP